MEKEAWISLFEQLPHVVRMPNILVLSVNADRSAGGVLDVCCYLRLDLFIDNTFRMGYYPLNHTVFMNPVLLEFRDYLVQFPGDTCNRELEAGCKLLSVFVTAHPQFEYSFLPASRFKSCTGRPLILHSKDR